MVVDSNSLTATSGPRPVTLFVWIFAISSIWHYTSSGNEIANYLLQFHPEMSPFVYLSIGTAMIAAIWPNRVWAILIFATGQIIAIGYRFPHVADHLVMELALNVGIVLSFVYLALRHGRGSVKADDMFSIFAPVGRWLLIIMYFFGTFHKINPGFLSLESSCAVPFITAFPIPAAVLQTNLVQWVAIYGTLIFEFIAMLLLFSARGKYYGMLIGMSFHFIIGISEFGTIAHFSAFAIALHMLFLPSGFGQRLVQDPWIPSLVKSPGVFRQLTIALLAMLIASALHLGLTRQAIFVNTLFGVFGLCVMILVLRHGKTRSDDEPYRLVPALPAASVIPAWFFLHCLSPYVGLGTGGTVQMFSGLRTEGGVSNHYIITRPLRLFPYQDTIIYIEETQNASLQRAQRERQGVLLFDFQRHFMERESLALPITVSIDGNVYSITGPETLKAFAATYFRKQSWLEKKYLSFRLVDDPYPNQCRH